MRKCGTCGYLLFGEGESCTHCGAPVPVAVGAVPQFVAQPTPPPAPAAVGPGDAPRIWSPPAPVAPPPGPQLPQGSMPPPPPPPAGMDGGPEFWRPAAPTTARPSRSFARPMAIFLALALVAGGVIVRQALTSDGLPSGTSAFVAGHGVPYVSPDGAFDAEFPVQPTPQTDTIPMGSMQATMYSAFADSSDSYEMGIGELVLPVRVPVSQTDDLLKSALDAGLAKAGGKVVNEQTLHRGGYPALEASATAPDGYKARVLVVFSGQRVYVVLVHAKTGTDKLFAALDKSLEIHAT